MDIMHSLQTRGWAVIMNYDDVKQHDGSRGSIFSEGKAPTAQQALYYETGPDPSKPKQPPRVPIFEGVKINSGHGAFETVMSSHGKQSSSDASEVEPSVRHMMKPSRSKTSMFQQYQDLHLGQMNDVIESMFQSGKGKINPGDPKNWLLQQNIVWGGIDHQHPHTDQGKAGCFLNEEIFPFVCIHGFGESEFDLWVLPAKKKREYGFLYTFPPKAMFFMRGDFIHAGGCRDESRAHMLFFPLEKAGWTRSKYPYWFSLERYDKWTAKDATYLVQDLRTYPFGFPSFGDELTDGSQTVTYPPHLTNDLMEDLCEDDTSCKRKASDNNQCNQGRRKYKKIDYSRITAGNKW
jgi:hypothetical protein